MKRKVRGLYRRYIENKYHDFKFDLGYFHQWGVESTEFEQGAVTDTMAIVELPDGTIITTSPNCIQFLERTGGHVRWIY